MLQAFFPSDFANFSHSHDVYHHNGSQPDSELQAYVVTENAGKITILIIIFWLMHQAPGPPKRIIDS